MSITALFSLIIIAPPSNAPPLLCSTWVANGQYEHVIWEKGKKRTITEEQMLRLDMHQLPTTDPHGQFVLKKYERGNERQRPHWMGYDIIEKQTGKIILQGEEIALMTQKDIPNLWMNTNVFFASKKGHVLLNTNFEISKSHSREIYRSYDLTTRTYLQNIEIGGDKYRLRIGDGSAPWLDFKDGSGELLRIRRTDGSKLNSVAIGKTALYASGVPDLSPDRRWAIVDGLMSTQNAEKIRGFSSNTYLLDLQKNAAYPLQTSNGTSWNFVATLPTKDKVYTRSRLDKNEANAVVVTPRPTPAGAWQSSISSIDMRKQVEIEAKFLKSLPNKASWLQVKEKCPAGTKFKYLGFGFGLPRDTRLGSETVGNVVEITGPIKGYALLCTQQQSKDFLTWLESSSQSPFPNFAPQGTDSVSWVELDIGKGQLGSSTEFISNGDIIEYDIAKSEKEYQARLSFLQALWGEIQIPKKETGDHEHLESGFDLEWPGTGLSYGEHNYVTYCDTLARAFSPSFAPTRPALYSDDNSRRIVPCSSADISAISAAMSGKPQSRLSISKLQLSVLSNFQLDGIGDFDGVAVGQLQSKTNYDFQMIIHVFVYKGKRLISIGMPWFD